MISRNFLPSGGRLLVAGLLIAMLLMACSTTGQNRPAPTGTVRLTFTGKSCEIPYVRVSRGYNMTIDRNLEAQKAILNTNIGDESVTGPYDSSQSVPGTLVDFTSGRSKVMLKYDTRALEDPVEVTMTIDGVVTSKVTLRKNPILGYQIIQF